MLLTLHVTEPLMSRFPRPWRSKIEGVESSGARALTSKTVNRARHSDQIADVSIEHRKTLGKIQLLDFAKHGFHRWGRGKSKVRVLTQFIFLWFRTVNCESKLLLAMFAYPRETCISSVGARQLSICSTKSQNRHNKQKHSKKA